MNITDSQKLNESDNSTGTSNDHMQTFYVSVSEDDTSTEREEFELESDGTLLLSTLKVLYPNATGLKFRNPTSGAFRTLKALDGRIHPPQDSQGWRDRVFYIVYPKSASVDADTSRKRPNAEQTDLTTAKRQIINDDEALIDIILLGLNYSTTEDEAKEYFSQFGPIDMIEIKKDASGKSRGFGFVRFRDGKAQNECLKRRHNISGRWVEAKRPTANIRGPQSAAQESNRLFVTRLSQEITPEDLREYFSQYGEVIDSYMPKVYRGFGFITFDNADSATMVLNEGERHTIKGERAVVSRAEPRQSGMSRDFSGFGRGFRGRSNDGGNMMRGSNYANSSSNPYRSVEDQQISDMVNMVLSYQRGTQQQQQPSHMMQNFGTPPADPHAVTHSLLPSTYFGSNMGTSNTPISGSVNRNDPTVSPLFPRAAVYDNRLPYGSQASLGGTSSYMYDARQGTNQGRRF